MEVLAGSFELLGLGSRLNLPSRAYRFTNKNVYPLYSDILELSWASQGWFLKVLGCGGSSLGDAMGKIPLFGRKAVIEFPGLPSV